MQGDERRPGRMPTSVGEHREARRLRCGNPELPWCRTILWVARAASNTRFHIAGMDQLNTRAHAVSALRDGSHRGAEYKDLAPPPMLVALLRGTERHTTNVVGPFAPWIVRIQVPLFHNDLAPLTLLPPNVEIPSVGPVCLEGSMVKGDRWPASSKCCALPTTRCSPALPPAGRRLPSRCSDQWPISRNCARGSPQRGPTCWWWSPGTTSTSGSTTTCRPSLSARRSGRVARSRTSRSCSVSAPTTPPWKGTSRGTCCAAASSAGSTSPTAMTSCSTTGSPSR